MRADAFDPAERIPLTPIAFEILLSLMDDDLHGYAIMQAVEERSGGGTSLHAGTLYRALSRQVDGHLIEELAEAPEAEADGRRRYYRITKDGRAVAAAESPTPRESAGYCASPRAVGSDVGMTTICPTLGERLYGVILALYPRRFRQREGAPGRMR